MSTALNPTLPNEWLEQLYNVILDLAGSYRNDNPYHNFAHAVDVLQCSYYFLRKLGVLPYHANVTGPQGLLRPIDIFGFLVAALGHDAAHPGVNNLFLVKLIIHASENETPR